MTETLHRQDLSVPAQREPASPGRWTAPDDWTHLTPEQRRASELRQLQIDLAAGR